MMRRKITPEGTLMNAERRTVILGDWHPIAKTILAIVALGLAIYFGVKGDTQDAVGSLIVLALCV